MESEKQQFAKAIVKEAEEKAKAIIREAKQREKEEIKRKEQELKQWIEKELKSYREYLEESYKESIAAAKIEGRKRVSEEKEEKVKELINKLVERFEEFRKTSLYKAWIKDLLERALQELRATKSDVIVKVRKGDAKIVKSLGFKVEESLDEIGGVIVVKKDGKVAVNYSFSTLLENAVDVIRTLAHKELF